MKKVAIFLTVIAALAFLTPGVCGSLSTTMTSGSTAAANIKQKEIEAAQVDANLFEDVDPDLAFALREMRLSNEHGNNTIARVAESADRSQTAIAYSGTLNLGLAVLLALIVAFIVTRAGKQVTEVGK
jgi:hypothetical protein